MMASIVLKEKGNGNLLKKQQPADSTTVANDSKHNSNSKKKKSISFKKSPRTVKVANPNSARNKTSIRESKNNVVKAPTPTVVKHITYIPHEESSLPELSQAVIQKKVNKMLHLLDTRPVNYVCVTDRRNRNCLHYAAYLGYTEILDTLLQRNDSKKIIDAKDEVGKTPLFKALESNSSTCVESLLDHGCDVKITDDNGISVMHVAGLQNNTLLMKMLWKSKADLNAKDKLGFTPLHLTAGLGLKDPTLFLLRKKAHVDPVDNKGRTPLLAAAADGNAEIIEILLQFGANAAMQDTRGRTAKNIFASQEKKFDDIKPTSMPSSHHLVVKMPVDRSNSFINDIRKVHDEPVNEIMASRSMTPKSTHSDKKQQEFKFDENAVNQLLSNEPLTKSERLESGNKYKEILSPIDWKALLSSPRKIAKMPPKRPPPPFMSRPVEEEVVMTPTVVLEQHVEPQWMVEDVRTLPPELIQMTDDGQSIASISQTSQQLQHVLNTATRSSSMTSLRRDQRLARSTSLDQRLARSTSLSSLHAQTHLLDTGLRSPSVVSQLSQPGSILVHQDSDTRSPQATTIGYPLETLVEAGAPQIPRSPSTASFQSQDPRFRLQSLASQTSQQSSVVDTHYTSVQSETRQPPPSPLVRSASQSSILRQQQITPQLLKRSTSLNSTPTIKSGSLNRSSSDISQGQLKSILRSPRNIRPFNEKIANPSNSQQYTQGIIPSRSDLPPDYAGHQIVQPHQQVNYPYSGNHQLQPQAMNGPHEQQHQQGNYPYSGIHQHHSQQQQRSYQPSGNPNADEKAYEEMVAMPSFEEDRYLFMCLKNRELLLKKIQRCESLEAEIRSTCKDGVEEKQQHSKPVEASFAKENSTLRDEVAKLRQENLNLSQNLLFNSGTQRDEGGKRRRRKQVFSDEDDTDALFSEIETDAEDDVDSQTDSEADEYFQDTINRLLKENILLKRSHKAYERCYQEVLDENEEQKQKISDLELQLKAEQEKQKTVEKEHEGLMKAHVALEQAHMELDYGMKKMLEDNVNLKKDLNYLESKENREPPDRPTGLLLPNKPVATETPPIRPDPAPTKSPAPKPRKPRKKMFILF